MSQKKLIYVNSIPQEFEEHKEYIEEVIAEFFDELDADCVIKVQFIEHEGEHGEFNSFEHMDCGMRFVSATEYELLIANSVLKTISNDRGAFFYCAIFHEFEHITDYIRTMQTNLFDFNLSLTHQQDFEQQYVATGYCFWTEIYAYYQTIMFAGTNKLGYESIKFSKLVSNYNKIVQRNKQLCNKQDLSYDEAVQYIDFVNSFVYLCAKFMGSCYAAHSYIPHAKIAKDKSYKKVFNILKGCEPKVRRLLTHQYDDNFYVNLFILGKYICENIKWKVFEVGLTKKDGLVAEFY